MQIVKIDGIKGAEYNPRFLSDESFAMLQESIRELGVIKPIIVRAENSTIIAGHQRTKAMAALGIEECPAYVLKGLNYADEVRFNQLHNACELEVSPKAPKVQIISKMPIKEGFLRVKNKDIEIVELGSLNTLCNVLSKLLLKYGEFGCPICTPDGVIRISAAYAYSAKVTGHDIDVLCLDKERAAMAMKYLSQQYGVFCYDTLEKKTYHQRFTQKKRLRDGSKGEANSAKSFLYERYVLPYLKGCSKEVRVLDFGAGQKDYVKKLLRLGYKVTAVDPYHMKEKSNDIDIRGNAADFQKIAIEIEKSGLYDIVICDSVLNSVDSMDAEKAVVATVRSLCKVGGMIFISGRNLEREKQRGGYKNIVQADSFVHFYDKDNFSAIYRNGEWFYQKFHSQQEINDIAQSISPKAKIYYNAQAFEICSTNDNPIELEEALKGLRYEWNLPLPNGMRYGLHNTIEKSYLYCISNH